MRPTYGDGGLVERTPATLLESVVEAGRAGARRRRASRSTRWGWRTRARRCSPGTAASGEPLTAAVVWQDRRSAGVCDRLAPVTPTGSPTLTGLTLDPYFAAPKMAWLRENVTPRRCGHDVATRGWCTALTGAFVTDASTASRTMLLDLDACAWSAEAVGSVRARRRASCPSVVDVAGAFGAHDRVRARSCR